MLDLLSSIALCATALAAALHDVRTRRIPNGVALAGTAAALALRLAGGLDPFLAGLLGALLGLALGLVLFGLGIFGGGDGKFLMAVGAFLGPKAFGASLLVIALIGGVLGLVQAIRNGAVRRILSRTGSTLLHLGTLGRMGWRPQMPARGVGDAALTVPYGVAIALGALITWFLGVTLP